METPEGRELRRQWSTKKRKIQAARKVCLTDIAKRSRTTPRKAKETEKAVQIMADQYNIEDTMRRKRYEPQWKSCKYPERPANDWQRPLVLDFTKSRRLLSRSDHREAEEFLASLLDEKTVDQRLNGFVNA